MSETTDAPTTREAVLDTMLSGNDTLVEWYGGAEQEAKFNASRDVCKRENEAQLDAYVQQERDAATTAERDRIRHAVDARKMAHDPECPVCQKGPNCAGLLIMHSVNAALADVARIIDAEAP